MGGDVDRRLERPGHSEGGPPLRAVEAGVAARQRQSVGLAHRGAPDDLDTEVEVGDQPAHDGELLEVLLAEHREVGAHGGEQLGDHGGDTVEVAGAGGALHHLGERTDRTVVWNPAGYITAAVGA